MVSSQVSSSRVSGLTPAANQWAHLWPGQSGGAQGSEAGRSEPGEVFWQWTLNLTLFFIVVAEVIIIYSFIEIELIYSKLYIKCATRTLYIYTYMYIGMYVYVYAFIWRTEENQLIHTLFWLCARHSCGMYILLGYKNKRRKGCWDELPAVNPWETGGGTNCKCNPGSPNGQINVSFWKQTICNNPI